MLWLLNNSNLGQTTNHMKQREQEIERLVRERETSAQQLEEHSNVHTAFGQKGRRERKKEQDEER